ncbi:MAG TPA: hypothetical protein VE397_05195 [Stellaceae bacterium]|nr:hypothetical protein [Stellaceae bacterium]
MPRKFRLTCARTTYFEVELSADTVAEAERQLERALQGEQELIERCEPLGRPIHRVVEVATDMEADTGLEEAAA